MKPTRTRFLMLGLIFVSTVLNYVDRANLALTAPDLALDLKIEPDQLGWLLSSFGWSYALCQIPGGWLVDRLRPRTLLTIILAAWSLCTVLVGAAGTFAAMFGLRLVIGVLEAPSYPVNNRVITTWFPERERASATATFLSGQFVGLAFFMPALAWVQHASSWRMVFVVTGCAGIAWAAVWHWLYRDPRESAANAEEIELIRAGGGLVDLGSGAATSAFAFSDLLALLSRRKLWGVYLGQFAVSSTLWFFLTWFPTYLVKYRGMESMRAGFMASLPYLAALVGVLSAGVASDALLRRGWSMGRARKSPIICGLCLSIGIIGANYVASQWLVIAFMAVAFLGCGMSSITWSVVSAIAPKRLLGLTSGVFNLIGNSAAVVTPLAVGHLVNGRDFAPALVYMALVAAMGAASYVLLVGSVERLPDPALEGS